MQELLNTSIAGNNLLAWLKAALWVIVAVGVMRGLVPVAIARLASREPVKQYDLAYWTRHVLGQFAKLTGSAK